MMLGFLLARSGIDVVVLEKWPDFFRDFRGDTIHPSTMEILRELGLLSDFLKLPHNKVSKLEADVGSDKITIADFSHLKIQSPYIAFMPQWDFLTFIADQARKYKKFHLMMETEAIDLIKENNRVVGVKARNKEEEFEIHSELVVGADGRHSTVREKSDLKSITFGSPMDVLWFRISREKDSPLAVLGKVDMGKMMIMIDRDSYWQCGYIIRKGDYENIKSKGLDRFKKDIVELVPELSEAIEEIKNFDQIKLLTVTIDRLKRWYQEGLLCIGDSAHAMSPIGGVGINLAIQDAVAAANILVPVFLSESVSIKYLSLIQNRRELAVVIIQKIQVLIQNRVIKNILGKHASLKTPWQIRLFERFPYLRRLPAYLIGMGFRREHVKTKEIL
jgi:2-polyprenyl-6-methoxyphenol hydroxylase-like FAD-dependent oxidoreductase